MGRRYLGLDFGDKTVGVAVSDPTGMIAQGVEIIRREKPGKYRRTLSRIAELCETYAVDEIVLGLPLMEDGSEGERCERTRVFAAEVKRRTGRKVSFCDERFTTVEAYDIMREANVSAAEHKAYVDEVAAMIILQEYLDRNNG